MIIASKYNLKICFAKTVGKKIQMITNFVKNVVHHLFKLNYLLNPLNPNIDIPLNPSVL